MASKLLYSALFTSGVVFGALADDPVIERFNPSEPAYLVGAATITDFENLPTYRAKAEPLARKGGYIVVASGDTERGSAKLLEGEWPANGLLFIEKYDSMEDLLTFANSPEFAELEELRDTVADMHFMFALPSGENGTTSSN
jgi:uncharacterized protein (DUF1330 family)